MSTLHTDILDFPLSQQHQPASVGKRLLAYLIDEIPLTLLVLGFMYAFTGFRDVYEHYKLTPRDHGTRVSYIFWRIIARSITLVLWVLYGMLMDVSRFQGSFGKYLVGIKVVDDQGSPLNPTQAIQRNIAKIASILPLSLGVIWILFDPRRASWHDKLTKTYVVEKD